MRKIIVSLIAALYGVLLTVPAFAVIDSGSSEIDATVNVLGQCSLTVDLTPLAFKKGGNDLLQGDTSDTLSRNADLAGHTNTLTTVEIYGSGWEGIDVSHTMVVGQTDYHLDSNPFADLPGSSTFLYSGYSDEQHTVKFQVTIPYPQAADTYSQTITISFSC